MIAIAALLAACTSESIEQTTTSIAVETSVFTLPELPIEDVLSKFAEGELVAVFGIGLEDRATLWGLPTDNAPFATGGSGNFDRQATDLIASGIASSYDGETPWEHFRFGPPDPLGLPLYGGYIPPDKTGFLGASDDVTAEVAAMTNERVDDLAADVAQFFADSAGLEAVQITQRAFGGRELTVISSAGRDMLVVSFGWSIPSEHFSWSSVEFSGDEIEVVLGVGGEVGSFG